MQSDSMLIALFTLIGKYWIDWFAKLNGWHFTFLYFMQEEISVKTESMAAALISVQENR